MKAFVIAVVLLTCGSAPWGAERAGAQGVGDSCLVPWQDSPLFPGPGYGWGNPDSVKVDMCQGPQQLSEFARNEFQVTFLYFIVPDSMDDTTIRTWRDIDTAYTSIRNGFDTIEQRFGPFTMQLYSPSVDTSAPAEKTWWINFEHYVNIDTAAYSLGQMPELNIYLGAYFAGNPFFYEGVNQSQKQNNLDFWPQPCRTQLFVRGFSDTDSMLAYDVMGRQITLPVDSSEGLLTIDVSKQPDGVLYLYISGHFYKILIQR